MIVAGALTALTLGRIAMNFWCQRHPGEWHPPAEWVEEAVLAWHAMRTRPEDPEFHENRARYAEFYRRLPESLAILLFPKFDQLERNDGG